ncbi:MAG: reductive dehalogenase [Chloroflexi bacterium]|nr:reductive dehalogenase [Chloroflexota bacterium]
MKKPTRELSLSALFDSLSCRSARSTYRGTLAATVAGMKHTDRTAAERYEVQPDYQRFNQKMNMTRRGLWQPEIYPPESNMDAVRAKHVQAQKGGFGVLDWAFNNASMANQAMTNFGINVPNHGPTSWKPIGPRIPAGVGRWSGDPATNARVVKKIGRIYGAGDVGIALLDRRWVYADWFDPETGQSYPIRFSDEGGYEHVDEPAQLEDRTQVIPTGMKYVAVFVLPMLREGVRSAPTLAELAATMATYSSISRFVASVAEFIRGLGYHAIPSSNCTALNIPLAIDAGLGELGRNAKLIHPVWGPVCRICKVITDLPLEPDVPIETGATTFCDSCGKCAEACPSQAIPRGFRSFEPAGDFSGAGVKQWQLNHGKCYKYWNHVGTNCGICLASCPFNKGSHWSHQVVKAAIARFPALDPLIVGADNAFGYGTPMPDTFWDDVL